MNNDKILLSHGSGGIKTHDLIKNIFYKHFKNKFLETLDDSAVFNIPKSQLAFTTDSYVITPYFFPGGDIGKLAVCGTVNDLTCQGATPLYISCGFIIEEGFSIKDLERIVLSMAKTAKQANVKIITGDTKVVRKNEADGIFINTSGIGIIQKGISISSKNAKTSDKIIVTGTIGDHGASILIKREGLEFKTNLKSDCAPLNNLAQKVLSKTKKIHVIKDPTRGGLATTLNEIAQASKVNILINEKDIPVRPQVNGVCEILGIDPLYMANEGKIIIIASEEEAVKILPIIKKHEFGKDAKIIGQVLQKAANPQVFIKTKLGTKRILNMLTSEQMPRIC